MISRTTRYDPKAKYASLYWQYSSLLREIKQDDIKKLNEHLRMTSEDLLQTKEKLQDTLEENRHLYNLLAEKDQLILRQNELIEKSKNERDDFDFCE